MRRARLPAVLLAALACVPACSGPPQDPEVTFSVDGETVRTGPTRYCDVDVRQCEADPGAEVRLSVPSGRPVQIAVPGEVAETPWQVVFRYRPPGDGGAEAVDGRSELFAAADERLAYTLEVPDGGQLEALEVQQFGLPAIEDGVPTFLVRGTWSLIVEP